MMRIMIAERSTLNKEFKSLGLGQMWEELFLDVKSAYKIIEERIYYTKKQNMFAKLSNSNKCISTFD